MYESLSFVPLVDERTVTTLSLPCHSIVTTWGNQCSWFSYSFLKKSFSKHILARFRVGATTGIGGGQQRIDDVKGSWTKIIVLFRFLDQPLFSPCKFADSVHFVRASARKLKVLTTILYFNFHFFPHLLIFLQFRDPTYILNLSTKAVLQKWHI